MDYKDCRRQASGLICLSRRRDETKYVEDDYDSSALPLYEGRNAPTGERGYCVIGDYMGPLLLSTRSGRVAFK